MAKIIRRHWKLALCQLLLVIGIVVLAGHLATREQTTQAADAEAPEAPVAAQTPPLDELTFSRVTALRERLCLRAEDLAALGCSRQQAETILTALVSWVQQESGAWQQFEQDEIDAQRRLQDAVTRINVGPRDEAVLASVPGLEAARARAGAMRQQHMDQALTRLSLSAEQVETLQTARANASVPARWRYARGITAEQVKTLTVAAYKGRLDNVESATLVGSSRTAMNEAGQRQQASMEAVLAAEASVLVLPEGSSFPQ